MHASTTLVPGLFPLVPWFAALVFGFLEPLDEVRPLCPRLVFVISPRIFGFVAICLGYTALPHGVRFSPCVVFLVNSFLSSFKRRTFSPSAPSLRHPYPLSRLLPPPPSNFCEVSFFRSVFSFPPTPLPITGLNYAPYFDTRAIYQFFFELLFAQAPAYVLSPRARRKVLNSCIARFP